MTSAAPSPTTLGLELTTSAGTRYLAFAPGDDRVFVLGSSAHADVRLDCSGVSPVEFHVERRGDELWLVPAKRDSSVLLDARPVSDATLLPTRAVIEVARERIVAVRFDATALVEHASPPVERHAPHYLASLPAETDPTCLALPRQERPDATELLLTQVMATRRLPPIARSNATDAGPGMTVLLPVVAAKVVLSQVAPVAHSLSAQPTLIEAPAALPGPDAAAPLPLAPPPRADASLLARLGMLARKRPGLAVALTIAAAACVAAPLAGLARAGSVRAPQASAARANPSLVPAGTRPTPALNPAPEPPASSASGGVARAMVTIVRETAARPAIASSALAPKDRAPKGPADHDVVEAVSALASGRDGQARVAYERLAVRSPENPTYGALARLLGRLESPECTALSVPVGTSCPEVRR